MSSMHSCFDILQTKYLQMIHISGNISLAVTHVTGESPCTIIANLVILKVILTKA